MTKKQMMEARSRLGWPRWRLAEELGVHENTVARWEWGERRISRVVEIAVKVIEKQEEALRKNGGA